MNKTHLSAWRNKRLKRTGVEKHLLNENCNLGTITKQIIQKLFQDY